MKKFLLVILLIVSIFTLSGCSQEPAQETVQNKKSANDYRYLSQAIDANKASGANNSDTASLLPKNAIPPAKAAPARNESAPISPAPEAAPTEETSTSPTTQDTEKKETENQNTTKKEDDSSLIRKYDGAVIKTTKGDITVKFYNDDAPKTVENFFKLASENFYDGIRFHRVIKGFVIQVGDPNSKDDNWTDDGQGGPGYTFADEINSHKLIEGSVAMANAGPNTNGSQFFILTAKSAPLLDGKYTNFGEVTDGMDAVRKIEDMKTNENDHPLENIEIKSVRFLKKS